MRIMQPDLAVSTVCPEADYFINSDLKMIIGGRRSIADAGETIEVYDPATGSRIASVPRGTANDVDRAVKAARAALDGEWSRLLASDRQRLMLKLADLIEENGEELAQIETLNNGKSILFSRLLEVGASAEYVRYMAGWATKIEGSTLDVSIAIPPGTRYQAFTRKEPVGVVAAITPWNFPLNMACWKIAPALASGCTVVLKPAEETPLTAIRLAELCLEAGFPPGVVNVVTGLGTEAGAALVAHPGVAKITFTGSTEVGKKIGIEAMRDMKRVTLELGGKAPMIMFDDMDISLLGVATGIGALFNSGQTCCAGTRIYAQRGIYEKVMDTVAGVVSSLSLGPGFDPRYQINPLVSAKQRSYVERCIETGIEQGAKPLLDWHTHDGRGFYVKPQVFTEVRQDMAIMQEEIFGPVITVSPFDDAEEAITLANDTRYGLGASLWTTDINKIMRYVPRVHAGTVWVNSHNIPDQNMPFGGVKQSGLGREHGRGAVENYLETKSVCIAYQV